MKAQVQEVKSFRTCPRICDSCGCQDNKEVFSRGFRSNTRSSVYVWDTHIVICQSCGFVYASPVPLEDDLNAYYADSFLPNPQQMVDYRLDKRLSLIDEYIQGDASIVRFLEIGSNDTSGFHEHLLGRFQNILSVEPNQSCVSTCNSAVELPSDCADMLAAYFVLEHVASPVAFFQNASRLLRAGGLFIVEVPDIALYPSNPVALLLYEHLNHFSKRTLERIARVAGFELVETSSEKCSRAYGFVSVFRNVGNSFFVNDSDMNEFVLSSELLDAGKSSLERYFSDIVSAQTRLEESYIRGWKSVVWGANDVCIQLFQDFHLLSSTVVVDSNPEKKSFFGSIPVLLPEEASRHIRDSKLFIICTRRHALDIAKQIKKIVDRETRYDSFVLDVPGFGL